MSSYVVLCDCDGDPNPRIIAWVDDERPAGGVRIRSNTAFSAVKNADGHITYSIRCRACKRWVPWSEATAADVIDRLAQVRDTLEVRGIPALDQPGVEPSEEWLRRRHDEVLAELRGERVAGQPPTEPVIPDATYFETRYVIPFQLLCRIVTMLREDT